MPDPETGEATPIDLSPWADRNPNTLLQLRWYWDNQEALGAVSDAAKSGGPQAANSVAQTIHHLIRDHDVAVSDVSRAVEAQHEACHRGT